MPDVKGFLAENDLVDSLTDAECVALLASRTFGRVGVTSGGLPVILPVRYLYADGAITFRTGIGTKLRAAESGDVLAFEVDAYDPNTSKGWSVLAQGRASILPTEPGPAGDVRSHCVRLHCELLTGRRLSSADG